MSNQIKKTLPKTYDAGDMHDLASLAASDMGWMNMALHDVQQRVLKIKEELTKHDINAQYHFYVLEQMLGMYGYLAEERTHCHEKEAEIYKAEWETLKRGEA
jgi:hypothetical protein